MLGHAVANACYLGAANRVGREVVEGAEQSFYGTSFICDYAGEILAEAGRTEETVLVAPLNLDDARAFRAGMGFFRDRRPDLYGPLLTRDGKTRTCTVTTTSVATTTKFTKMHEAPTVSFAILVPAVATLRDAVTAPRLGAGAGTCLHRAPA